MRLADLRGPCYTGDMVGPLCLALLFVAPLALNAAAPVSSDESKSAALQISWDGAAAGDPGVATTQAPPPDSTDSRNKFPEFTSVEPKFIGRAQVVQTEGPA